MSIQRYFTLRSILNKPKIKRTRTQPFTSDEFKEPQSEKRKIEETVELGQFLASERNLYTVYPPEKDVYAWTNAVKFSDIRVVILGQDPYHGPNEAHGLAFSVRKGVLIPRSLANIYRELATDIPGFKAPNHGNLYGWASQGVLLLNSCLTVRANCANSHHEDGYGWTKLTDAVIACISNKLSHVVFMLWGRLAKTKTVSLIRRST